MNKVRVDQLEKMLQALVEKTGLSITMKNLQHIAEQIDGVGGDYLYKKIYNPIQKLKKNEMIGLRADQLNSIAQYLGYDDFRSFVLVLDRKKDPQLESLVGRYYSYVRRNAKECMVLRSPVRIWERRDGKICFELKGPSQSFGGEIHNRYGCLFILMEAKGGKVFHHVYKIGERKAPKVLQGTFSGVSTAFDPIGGRAVLIRVEDSYESMHNSSLEIGMLKKSTLLEERKLTEYFRDYNNNNVAPNRSSTFGVEDL